MITALKKVKKVAISVGALQSETKNAILCSLADILNENADKIILANSVDINIARENNMPESFIDRLSLDKKRIEGMAEGLFQLADLHDCIGEELSSWETAEGLQIKKVRVPFGVVAIIYEARPNVTIDAFGLNLKSGNCSVLRGSKDAYNTNAILVKLCQKALEKHGVSVDAIYLVEDLTREGATFLMGQREYIDVLIPRGGAGLIKNCVENSKIPVIETGTGNCHLYVHESADFDMAIEILKNAKLQRVSVCNACESLVVDASIAGEFLPLAEKALKEGGVQIFGCEKTCKIIDCDKATDEDFFTEYVDYKISVKVVNDYVEAIEHVNTHSTKHSETIVAKDAIVANIFTSQVDSACVYHNVSTRFTDGFMFGFGAEIGISTQKLHARGPMGLAEITSYKYIIEGNGEIRK
ncbi:MAG: glutamate-5-semialdehyde dehydrogenase [Bacillota bacterium]